MVESNFNKRITQPTTNSKPSIAEKIPEKIGPYQVEALLEKGGMSYLYLASHPETKDPITIKVLFPEFLSNPEMVQRFLREAEIIALADHPNIVKLYGQGEWENGLYIAMEFIQGISLRQYILRNLISLKHALELVMEISMALCHLHAHGVIHRDLKPENILITESGNIKVIDFGIAQLLTDGISSEVHSQRRRLIGTPIYMSPEQKENPESTSYPSDIYSLGIITYELVLGKLSHGQIHLSLMPKGLQKILTKALQPRPEDRYQDIVDFMTDLSAYINSPLLLKENKEIAPLSDLFDNLRQAQTSLLPQFPPQWPGLEVGLASYKSLGTTSFYYDFFELPNQAYGIIMGEPSVKGSPGIIHASVLRGMVRALCQLAQKPEEMATVLNDLLANDPMKQHFAFSYLILFPKEKLLRFISCGCGYLWYIPQKNLEPYPIDSEHEPLGLNAHSKFNDTLAAWDINDKLILYACLSNQIPTPNDPLFSQKQFQASLPGTLHLSPQKQVEAILRKAKINLSRTSSERSLFIFSLVRKE